MSLISITSLTHSGSLVGLPVWVFLLAAACQKSPPKIPVQPAAARPSLHKDTAPGDRPATAPQALAPRPQLSGRLRLLPEKLFAPNGEEHYDLSRPLVGKISEHSSLNDSNSPRCDVWNLQLGIYLGETAAADCASWPTTCDYQNHAAGVEAQVEAGILTLRATGTAAVRLDLGAVLPSCQKGALVRLSPDGETAAVACGHTAQVFLVNAHTGKLLGRPAIDTKEDKEVIGTLCWGPSGLIALTYIPYKATDCTCEIYPLPGHGFQQAPYESCHPSASQVIEQRAARARITVTVADHIMTISQRAASSAAVQLRLPAEFTDADLTPTVVAASPDGTRVLLRRKFRSLYVADLPAATLALVDSDCERCDGESAIWTPAGFVQYSDPHPKEEDWYRGLPCEPGSPQPGYGEVCRFSASAAPPQCLLLTATPGDNWSALLDPQGRYVFSYSKGERIATRSVAYDLAKDLTPQSVAESRRPRQASESRNPPPGTGPLGWTQGEDYTPIDTTLLPGRWLPGKFPVWQTIERTSSDRWEQYTAYRIFTAPGHRKLATQNQHIELSADVAGQVPLPELRLGVRDDGVTLFKLATGRLALPLGTGIDAARDPSGRFVATGAFSLRRLLDGQELTVRDNGCTFTAAGAYDCDLTLPATRWYTIGEEPITAPSFRGDQIAHLYYHPSLFDDFLDGKPVAPAPALGEVTGLPPHLTVLAVQPGSGGQLLLTVRVQDGGGGISSLRVWAQGRPLGVPISLTTGQQEVRFAAPSCRDLQVQACSAAGQVCTQPARLPCPTPSTK